MDTEPKGKWYDECPQVGQCGGESGSCANAVLEGFIIERFCKQSVEGKLIKAKLRKNSAIDDFGSVAGINTDVYCGRLGVIAADHDITDEVVFEDDPGDSNYKRAKVPFRAVNANHGGPYGLAGVIICWCCIEEGDPPCSCCATAPPPPPPKKYGCVNGACVEVGNGEYDEPTCGGNCDNVGPCCTDYGLSYVKRSKCAEWGGTFHGDDAEFDGDCGCDCEIGGDYCFTDGVPCGEPRPDDPDGHCGPGPNTGWTADYYTFSRGEQGGPFPYFCDTGDCSPLDALIEKGARIIGWFDYTSEQATEASSECCLGHANATRYGYRTFVLNCRTKEWEDAPNVMSNSNQFTQSSTAGQGLLCVGDYPPGNPDMPEAVHRNSSPTCLPPPPPPPNPLP